MTEQRAAVAPEVPRSRFLSDAVPARERFAVWSESIAPLFTPQVAPHREPEEVRIATDVYALGDALFGRSETSGVGGYRCPGNSITRGRSDAVLVQLYRRGGFVGTNGGEALRVRAGDVVVLDTTRVMATEVTDSTILSFVLPRETLLRSLGGPHLSPGVIAGRSPAGRVLAHAFRSTWEALPGASLREAEALRGLLLGAIGGVLQKSGGSPTPEREAALGAATLEAICEDIERNLDDDELSPEVLCQRFGCSRAHLYRLFEPVGGVATFIRRARLERVYAELSAATDGASILELALRWGFGNFSHFCRLFRTTFGMTPGEVRARGRALRRGPRVSPTSSQALQWLPEYRDWFLRL